MPAVLGVIVSIVTIWGGSSLLLERALQPLQSQMTQEQSQTQAQIAQMQSQTQAQIAQVLSQMTQAQSQTQTQIAQAQSQTQAQIAQVQSQTQGQLAQIITKLDEVPRLAGRVSRLEQDVDAVLRKELK